MKTIAVILGITLALTAGYAARDLTCFHMEEPNIEYVEAEVAIIPELAIANNGEQAEELFPVKFFAIDLADDDTVFGDTQQIDHIGCFDDPGDDPDTLFVEMDLWEPEGFCHEEEPFVSYKLLGIVDLDADEDRSNDTVSREVLSLWSHDVGVTDLWWIRAPERFPDIWEVGDTAFISATVENFGFNKEHDIAVRVRVKDVDSGDVVLWEDVKYITFLDWRGAIPGNPYDIDVDFSLYILHTDHMQTVTVQTELGTDLCSEDDAMTKHHIGNCGVEREVEVTHDYNLVIMGNMRSGAHEVIYTVPHASRVKLSVFDVTGRLVDGLADEVYQPGEYRLDWNDQHFASGLYFIRLDADDYTHACKLVVVK